MNDIKTTYADLAEKSAEDEKCKTGMTYKHPLKKFTINISNNI